MNLLFVCTANVSRSFLAEKLMHHQIRQRGLKNITAASAGVIDLEGSPPDPVMCAFLREQGVADVFHEARYIDDHEVDRADVILVMEKRHAETLYRRWPECREKVRLLGRLAAGDQSSGDIADPFGGSDSQYHRAQSQIRLAVEALAERLADAQHRGDSSPAGLLSSLPTNG